MKSSIGSTYRSCRQHLMARSAAISPDMPLRPARRVRFQPAAEEDIIRLLAGAAEAPLRRCPKFPAEGFEEVLHFLTSVSIHC